MVMSPGNAPRVECLPEREWFGDASPTARHTVLWLSLLGTNSRSCSYLANVPGNHGLPALLPDIAQQEKRRVLDDTVPTETLAF